MRRQEAAAYAVVKMERRVLAGETSRDAAKAHTPGGRDQGHEYPCDAADPPSVDQLFCAH